MNATRRLIVTMAGMIPMYALAGKSGGTVNIDVASDRLVLSDFGPEEEFIIPGASWRGRPSR